MFVRSAFRIVMVASVVTALASLSFAQESERTDLRIEMGEYYFQLEGQEAGAPIVLQAGQPYEIVFANVGEIEHEVLIGREVVTVDGAPDGYETNLLEDVEFDVVGDDWEIEASGLIEIELEEGETVTVHATVPAELAGEWEIGCFIPQHYENGMKAPFVIE